MRSRQAAVWNCGAAASLAARPTIREMDCQAGLDAAARMSEYARAIVVVFGALRSTGALRVTGVCERDRRCCADRR